MEKAFLVKYGEIGVKGKNRHIFEEALVRQIEHALKYVDGTFKVTRPQGRIFVEGEGFDEDEVIEALQKVFGIVWICPCYMTEDNGFDDLAREVCAAMAKKTSPLLLSVRAGGQEKITPWIPWNFPENWGARS